MTNRTNYYVSGNTADGFVNYLSSNIKEMKQVIVLKHPSNRVKTEIIMKVISHFERFDKIEVINSASGVQFLDGVIIRDKSLAIITDNIEIPELNHSTQFNLEREFEPKYNNRSELDTCNKHKQKAYDDFSKGLKIHDRLEHIFISQMDFSKADIVADEFMDEFLKDVQNKQRKPIIYHRLFGTNTEKGAINIVPELITNLSNRFYIKGRAGTGKSVFMKR